MKADPRKIDFHRLRKDLSRLTDVNYLKKEFNRISKELRRISIDGQLKVPRAQKAFSKLEAHFHELISSLNEVQKHLDGNLRKLQSDSRVQKMVSIISRTKTPAKARAEKNKKTSVRNLRSAVAKTSTIRKKARPKKA
jgi:hypothetical protein